MVVAKLKGGSMEGKPGEKAPKKGFFARLFDKLDKQMQEKARAKPCCGGADKSEKKSCCS